MDSSTIVAIATPAGNGGIGIIKISGTDAIKIASSIFHRGPLLKGAPVLKKNKCFQLKSHTIYHGYIVDYENKSVIDEVLLLIMLAPNSYTRDDVVEIHAHCGQVVIKLVLDLVLKHGGRLAEPGEFTKRAFLSGRIDLSQAEAVVDIINAKTKKALEAATSHIKGDFSSAIELIREFFLQMSAQIEAVIDFSDQIDEDPGDLCRVDTFRSNVTDKLKGLVNQYNESHVVRDGFKVIITGRPNVGKSSMMNRMIQQDRAIVTPFPGTTRDAIMETVIIDDVPVILTDSAGIHKTDDPVEKIGIQKACEHIRESHMVLFVVDVTKCCSAEDILIYEKIGDKPVVMVLNKSDLAENSFNFIPPLSWNITKRVATSALYNTGFDKLRNLISGCFLHEKSDSPLNSLLPNMRQKLLLDRCVKLASFIEKGLFEKKPFELIAIDVHETIDLLGEITGNVVGEDVLDQIFSRFCIGK